MRRIFVAPAVVCCAVGVGKTIASRTICMRQKRIGAMGKFILLLTHWARMSALNISGPAGWCMVRDTKSDVLDWHKLGFTARQLDDPTDLWRIALWLPK